MSIRRSNTAARVPGSIALAMAAMATFAGAAETAHHSSTVSVGGTTVQMSAANKAKLQKLQRANITVFYPTVVPKRYSLGDIVVQEETNPDGLDYTMQFGGPKNFSFNIESALTGIGDGPDGDRQLKGHSKVFGDFHVDVFKPGSEGNATKDVYYLSSWMKYKRSPKARTVNYHFLGTGVTDREAVQIVESLTPLSLATAK